MTDEQLLSGIVLDLMWVQSKRDRTERVVTLKQISEMPYRQRKNLHFIKDFRDETVTYIEREENDRVKIIEFNKACRNVGFIYFSNTDHCGVFYEMVYVTDSEAAFDAIRSAYSRHMNP